MLTYKVEYLEEVAEGGVVVVVAGWLESAGRTGLGPGCCGVVAGACVLTTGAVAADGRWVLTGCAGTGAVWAGACTAGLGGRAVSRKAG